MNAVDTLDQLVEISRPIKLMLWGVALSSARLMALFMILPATGSQFLNGLTRGGLVVMLGLYISMGLPAADIEALTAAQAAGLMLKEAMLGLVLGFVCSIVFWVTESVGALIDMQASYNNVQMTNPLSGQEATPVSTFLLQMVVAMFYVLGGMLVLMGALFESFAAWPVLSPLPSMSGVSEVFFLGQVDELFVAVVKFAAPVLLVLLLIDLGIGLITKAAEKLEPHSLSYPIKGAVTMLLLALMIGVFIAQVRHSILPRDAVQRMKMLIPDK